jgi:hypothetical protein
MTASVARAGALALVAFLGGCAGSSGTPQPGPTATGAPVTYLTAKRAGQAALDLALSLLHAHVLAAEFVRPGIGPLIPAPGAQPPTCDAVSATATSTTTDVEQGDFTTTFALYPSGDSMCAQAPIVIGAWFYANPNGPFAPPAGTPLVAQGFFEEFTPPSDPAFRAGQTLYFAANAVATITASADGAADVAITFAGQDDDTLGGTVPGVPKQPPAGTFPATFPVGLSAAPPLPLTSGLLDRTEFVAVESGARTEAGIGERMATEPFGATLSPTGTLIGNLSLQSSGVASVATAGTSTSGAAIASTGSSYPTLTYGFEPKVPVVLATFPPASGSAAVGLTPVSIAGFQTSADNYAPAQIIDTASVSTGGTVVSAHERIVDTVNEVQADVTASAGTTSFTVTDLLASKPLTAPASVELDALGISVPFTYVSDGTPGIVHVYKVIE